MDYGLGELMKLQMKKIQIIDEKGELEISVFFRELELVFYISLEELSTHYFIGPSQISLSHLKRIYIDNKVPILAKFNLPEGKQEKMISYNKLYTFTLEDDRILIEQEGKPDIWLDDKDFGKIDKWMLKPEELEKIQKRKKRQKSKADKLFKTLNFGMDLGLDLFPQK